MTTKITPKNVDRLQHVAVSRLTLYMAGRSMALFGAYQTWLADQVRQANGNDGLDALAILNLLPVAETRWRRVIGEYTALLQAARTQAADIAFTVLRVRNNAAFPQTLTRITEAFTPATSDWMKLAEMWLQRRNYALQLAQQRTWSDGLNLSQRIWRLENGGMQRIRHTLAAGMANRTNAVDLANELERQLGANMDYPRWTEARLRSMTASERARSQDGLIRQNSANPFEERGISYNALRLARNEIQYGNHAVTSDIAQHFPGIVGRKSVLSLAHPKLDICDEYAAGGPYGKDANFLPLHPQCVTPGQMVQAIRGAIPIEAVQVGDKVLTHLGRYRAVTAAWKRTHTGPVYRFETAAGKFELTGEHPVFTVRGWVNAVDLRVGDICHAVSFLDNIGLIRLDAIKRYPDYAGSVYNLTVDDDHSYTVNGHVVHNCMCRYEEVMMPPKEFAANVRGWVQNDNNFLDDYVAWLGQRQPGPWPAAVDLVGALDLWLTMRTWLDGNVDAMAHILPL